ncbi:TraR/DksA family transcriptional regulator [Candidatus Thalassolituus haligoni]|jgi:RNA polymerase-binding transcription factor DksA|uniref:TraR/DksA family transcriptional regulator n=1 Tax=Candidatus Thalassolituus haligoni TaxID=3100113 RepID=UPI0035197DBB|tara:strand:+ start:18036 stop:18377 length:342 start_codon:yes stop_codon:yes gene_type:complete
MNIDALRSRLRQQLDELQTRSVDAERLASHRDNPLSADFAEQATERENDEVLGAISGEACIEAVAIQQALERIEQGTYGSCIECGETIESARLEAVPYAIRCLQCASRHEQQA